MLFCRQDGAVNVCEPNMTEGESLTAAHEDLTSAITALREKKTLTLTEVRDIRALVSRGNSRLLQVELHLTGVKPPKIGD